MKPLPLIASHILVLLIAFFICRGVVGRTKDRSSSSPDTTTTPSPSSARFSADQADEPRSLHNRNPAEYAAAWESLASKRLSRTERQRLQVELLQAWAEVDLKGALTAALQEPWHEISWRGNIEELLKKGFAEAFLDQSPAVWDLINNQDLGILETALIRNTWIQIAIDKDPQLIVAKLPAFRGSALTRAVRTLADRATSPAEAQKLWQVVANLDLDNTEQSLLLDVGRITSGSHSITQLQELLSSDNSSLQTIAATSLAIRMAGEDADKALASIPDVPEHLRKTYTFDLLNNANENHDVIAGALNQLIDDEHWDLIANPVTAQRVKLLAQAGDAAAMSDWAVQLPEKIEAKELIHRSVAVFAGKDPDAAWSWLADLPDGLWRDRAYAEFSQQALWSHKDPSRSREALNQISDPTFQKEAERWRNEWIKNTGHMPE